MSEPITHCRVCGTHWSDVEVFEQATCAACWAKQAKRLQSQLDATQIQAEHHRTMSLARQEEVERLRAAVQSLQADRAKLSDELLVAEQERDAARQVARGMLMFLTNEEIAWACDMWPLLAEEEGSDG